MRVAGVVVGLPSPSGSHSESSQSTVLPLKISAISLGFSAAGKPRQRHEDLLEESEVVESLFPPGRKTGSGQETSAYTQEVIFLSSLFGTEDSQEREAEPPPSTWTSCGYGLGKSVILFTFQPPISPSSTTSQRMSPD